MYKCEINFLLKPVILILSIFQLIVGCAHTNIQNGFRSNMNRKELKGVCISSHTYTTIDTIYLGAFKSRKYIRIHSKNMNYDIRYDVDAYKVEKIIGVYCGNVRDSLPELLMRIDEIANQSDSIIDFDIDSVNNKNMFILLDVSSIVRLSMLGLVSIVRKADFKELDKVILKPWSYNCGDLCGEGGLGLYDNNDEIIRNHEWIS